MKQAISSAWDPMKAFAGSSFWSSGVSMNNTSNKKSWNASVKSPASAYAHCAEGIAVIGMAESQYFISFGSLLVLPVLNGHFDGNLHGCGSVIGVENLFKIPRKDFQKSFCKLNCGFMGEPGKDHVFQMQSLLINFACDVRISMTVNIHPPAADGIYIGVSCIIK